MQIFRDAENKQQQSHAFTTPIMKGSVVGELFARNAKLKQAETDWTIMEDAYEDVSNGPHAVSAVDTLRNESQNQRSSRSRNITRGNALGNVPLASTPIVQSPPIPDTNVSRNTRNASAFRQLNLDIVENDFYTPPSAFGDSPIAPAHGFGNAHSSAPLSIPHIDNYGTLEMNENSSQAIDCTDLIAILAEESLEFQTMIKLKKLWQRNVHPINVNSLLTPQSNRFQAAKTFAALLSM